MQPQDIGLTILPQPTAVNGIGNSAHPSLPSPPLPAPYNNLLRAVEIGSNDVGYLHLLPVDEQETDERVMLKIVEHFGVSGIKHIVNTLLLLKTPTICIGTLVMVRAEFTHLNTSHFKAAKSDNTSH